MSGPITPPDGGAPVTRPRCTARTKRGPCRCYPVHGATVCKSHGGAAPQVRAAAARRLEAARAEAAVRTLGLPDDRPPDEVILERFAVVAGHVLWLQQRVQAMDPDALVWGVTSEVDKQATEFAGLDRTSAAVPSVWHELYERWHKQLVDLYKVIKATSLDERRLEFARSVMAPRIVGVINDVVSGLGLTDEQAALVPDLLVAAVSRLRDEGRVIEGSVHSG